MRTVIQVVRERREEHQGAIPPYHPVVVGEPPLLGREDGPVGQGEAELKLEVLVAKGAVLGAEWRWRAAQG